MKPCRFHREAEIEYLEAVTFLENEAFGLGSEFMSEFADALGLISTFPEAWTVIVDDIHRFILSRFSYSVAYRIRGNAIEIIAVIHHHRKQFYWKDRLSE